MSARQFADRAFDPVTLLHLFLELWTLLIAAPLLQKLVILAHDNSAMRLSGGHTLRAQRTVVAMVTPFEAKTNFLTLGLFQSAALGAQKTTRTASASLADINVEGLDPKSVAQAGTIGTRLGWAN
jgi:hypothetical protein